MSEEISQCCTNLAWTALLNKSVVNRHKVECAVAGVGEVLAPDVEGIVAAVDLHLCTKQCVEVLLAGVGFVPIDFAEGFGIDIERDVAHQ